jgi:hypothetical protein
VLNGWQVQIRMAADVEQQPGHGDGSQLCHAQAVWAGGGILFIQGRRYCLIAARYKGIIICVTYISTGT